MFFIHLYIMKKEFTIIIEKGEDGYYLSDVVELPGCHTQAKTLDQLMKRTKEAIELYLEVSEEPVRESFVGVQKIQVGA
jgi:predicted RNase H-like HicB family nuclease